MYTFIGDNPTELHCKSFMKLINDGDECSPRGKRIKELRPACFEFTNPYNRVTFLGGRRINPFFQMAEALWILSGRADVEWLCKFNANMRQFSDDGVFFNGPYGERLRTWGKNSAHNIILNPVDQFIDVYTKLLADKDTRQAIMVLSNPHFDNSKYTIGEKGKDICCNMVITFKIRHNKLNMTVFNRSNDLIYGTFGANLNQFSTIQEVMLSWLKNSGNEEFKDLELGTYSQITDSLHMYLDDYGSKCNQEILDYYHEHADTTAEVDFNSTNELRMSQSQADFDAMLEYYWTYIDPMLMSDELLKSEDYSQLVNMLEDLTNNMVLDRYWSFVVKSMLCYRLVKLDRLNKALDVLSALDNCSWKVSMAFFLKTFIHNRKESNDYSEYVTKYNAIAQDLAENLSNKKFVTALNKYLELGE